MKDEIQLKNYEKQIEALLGRVRSSPNLSAENKMLILRYHDACFSEGLSQVRIIKYVTILFRIAQETGKDFDKLVKDDLIRYLTRLERSDHSEWTKRDYRITLKRFFRWLRGGDTYPEEVRWIKTTRKNNSHLLPDELLTEEEVKRMIQAAGHSRDRALIHVLYESGCRIGEILTLKVKHVQFDKYGAFIIVSGKTGMRRVRLIASCPALVNWLQMHPASKNPDFPLWLKDGRNKQFEFIGYSGALKVLKSAGRKAGIRKRIHPHLFRHSRATQLAQYLTEAQMKEFFGWTQGSDMASIYVHLSGRDVDNAILGLYGLREKDKSPEAVLKPKKCEKCEWINPPDFSFCGKCASALELKTLLDLDSKRQAFDELMTVGLKDKVIQTRLQELKDSDPEFQKRLKQLQSVLS
ncbi:MAG: tyrosine-type recombinase/integrase [candidate division Zixibacteria bacterium]|nr:tyrosine-type recombinase/integrase [candidate division Zixibacteria bacterium]